MSYVVRIENVGDLEVDKMRGIVMNFRKVVEQNNGITFVSRTSVDVEATSFLKLCR